MEQIKRLGIPSGLGFLGTCLEHVPRKVESGKRRRSSFTGRSSGRPAFRRGRPDRSLSESQPGYANRADRARVHDALRAASWVNDVFTSTDARRAFAGGPDSFQRRLA